jgi:hypothetical protein
MPSARLRRNSRISIELWSLNIPEGVYACMMEIYPARLNLGSLWGGAALSKQKK